MNNLTVTLSSNPSSTLIFNEEVYMSDMTNLTLNLTYASRTVVPFSLKIRWGDNTGDEFYTNNLFPTEEELSTVDEIVQGGNYTLLYTDYNHIFQPSATTLVRKLTCQALLTYLNTLSCRFVVPITIYSPSFHTKIGNLSLLNSTMYNADKNVLLTFGTEIDGSVLESVIDNTAV